MVIDEKELFVICDRTGGYNMGHIYLDEASAELALRNFFTATKVREGQIWIEKISAKKMQHCCEM